MVARQSDVRVKQIESVASSEPIGSRQFFIQFGVLGLGALAAVWLFGVWIFLWLFILYLGLFVLEKSTAQSAVRKVDADRLPLILAILTLRASTYNAMALTLWTLDGDIFKMGTLAMVTASTLNIMINQVSFRSTMACVAIPNFMVFVVISGMIYAESGISAEFFGSVIAIICILPYFVSSLMRARNRWEAQEQTKEKLYRAQRLESMGKVASGVSHDFNNLMSVVSSSLQLLDQSSSDAERRRLTRTALRAIEHGAELTRQMLALGRRSPLVPKATDLNQSIQEFGEFASHVLPASIDVALIASPRKAVASVDPAMLQNALLNLALNSTAAMPDGGRIEVRVDLQEAPEGFGASNSLANECVVVSVSDTGEGISRDDLEQVFEPFFTTRDVGKGSGLGLSMVKGFVEQSNGMVRVDSTLKQGTTVSLYFPQTWETPETSGFHLSPQSPMNSQRPKTKVLIVEDNPQLLDLLALKLERDGHDVIKRASADEALEILHDHSGIGVVVSDLVMPGLNQGMDVLRRAKGLPEPLPVILMSGYADVRTNNEKDLLMADCFLEKPLSLSQLSEEVQKLARA